ncbi:MAG: hypothetical protein ACQES4_01265, partial [Bacillota bacterium]
IIIEKEERLGGECSWTGCVPSKALIHQASLAYRSGSRTEDNVMEKVRETVLKASKASKVKALLDSRAITDDVAKGKVKIIASPYGKLLGVHILGPRAGELLGELTLARRRGLRLYDIGLTVHVYPTLGMAAQRVIDDWFSEQADKPLFKKVIRIFRR